MKNHTIDLKLTVLWNCLFITGCVFCFLPQPSSAPNLSKAYLDPGTGTMIISAIVGIFATLALGVKTFWYKLSHLFRSKDKTSENNK